MLNIFINSLSNYYGSTTTEIIEIIYTEVYKRGGVFHINP